MTKSKHIPKRRFKEFELDGEWEQEKLGEISNITAGGDVVKEKLLTKGNYPVLANAHTNEGVIGYYEEDYQVEAPAVTVTGRGDIGFAKARKENFTPVVRLLSVKSEHNVDFLAEAINQNNVVFESTGVPQLTIPKLSNYKVYFPSTIGEENSIGNFLVSFDSLIALHQHKLDKLKNLKKSYLAELFPAEGERVPKRRFPGFEGEWEEKKLASIASMHARIGWQNLRTSEFLDHGDYYLITGTDFLDGHINFDKCHYVNEKRFQQDKNIQVVNGSILITKDGTLGKVAIVNNLDKPATLNAGVFNVVVKDSNIDVKYLYQYLAAPYLMNYVSKRATGGTIKHLNQNILVDFPIYFPEYKEQKTIGNFLEKLDKSISLQQQKLDKLKDLKKAYLNELFV